METVTSNEYEQLKQVASALRESGHRPTAGAGGMDVIQDVLDQAVEDGEMTADRAGELYFTLELDEVKEITDIFAGRATQSSRPELAAYETEVSEGEPVLTSASVEL